MRILVAEAERDLHRLICRTRERAGYSVDACFDGEAAMDCLRGAEYDCLLLDIMMPKKDGHEAVSYTHLVVLYIKVWQIRAAASDWPARAR